MEVVKFCYRENAGWSLDEFPDLDSDRTARYGSKGGWDIFGPERIISKSKDNILFELDGKPALKLYKDYLREMAGGIVHEINNPLTIIIVRNNLKFIPYNCDWN